MVHQCYPDKCFNIGRGRVCTKCKSGYPFSVPQREKKWITVESASFITDMN